MSGFNEWVRENGAECMSYAQERQIALEYPTTSFWLRDAIAALEGRDPADAVNDLEVLLALAMLRFNETVARNGGKA